MALLRHARRHHLRWLVVDLLLLIISGILALVPGPNVLAYYFMFRVFGHLQSWRGAKQGADATVWSFEPDSSLTELGSLVDMPREARAPRVAAIAERLNLPHLSVFFESCGRAVGLKPHVILARFNHRSKSVVAP